MVWPNLPVILCTWHVKRNWLSQLMKKVKYMALRTSLRACRFHCLEDSSSINPGKLPYSMPFLHITLLSNSSSCQQASNFLCPSMIYMIYCRSRISRVGRLSSRLLARWCTSKRATHRAPPTFLLEQISAWRKSTPALLRKAEQKAFIDYHRKHYSGAKLLGKFWLPLCTILTKALSFNCLKNGFLPIYFACLKGSKDLGTGTEVYSP